MDESVKKTETCKNDGCLVIPLGNYGEVSEELEEGKESYTMETHCKCGLPNEWIRLSGSASFWGCKRCHVLAVREAMRKSVE